MEILILREELINPMIYLLKLKFHPDKTNCSRI